MRLQRLELFGFKTFADATEFVFDQGITAIIGPNGSGKSNCADALLWVLAERRLSVLRASEPADVIFAGSRHRRPLGYAEVNLTVDNADGSLPLDLTEVRVGRRIYRNGEQEYRLNGRICRRRDVIDLFLDTGVGRPAFSVISQREIDALLSLDPSDRRRLLDEVAGIERYRTQRDETLRKLNDAAASLTRVDDLTAELRLQVDPLAEQRRVAQDYLGLRASFEQLKLSLQVKDYSLSQRRLERTREELAGLDEAVVAASAAVAEFEAAEEGSRLALLGLDEQLTAARGELHEAALAVERQEGEIRVRRERLGHLESRLADAAGSADRHESDLAAEAAVVAEQRLEAERLTTELAALQQRVAALRAAAGASVDGETAAEQALAAARAELTALDRELATWRSRREAASETAATAARRLADLAERGRSAAERLAAAASAASEAEVAAETARAAATAARAAGSQTGEQRQAAEQRLAELRRELAELQEDLGERRGRLRALTDAAASYQGLYHGVKAVLQARDRGRLSADYQVVADVLRVADGCDAAFEAALGPRLQDLICPRGDDARDAIELLKRERAGRATFLPQDLLDTGGQPGDLARLRRLPGVVGHALDLVACDPAYETVRQHLLWNIVVTEDLDAGLAVRRAGFTRLTIVTREGDLIRTSGAMSGGSREDRGPTLLARRRESESVGAEVRELDDDLRALQAELAEAQTAQQAAVAAVAAAGRAVETAQRQLSEREQARLQARAAVERAEGDAARMGESEAQLRDDAAQAGTVATQAAGQMATAETRREALAVQVATAEATLQALRADRQSTDQELAAARVSAARLESRLQALAEASTARLRARESATREAERLQREREVWQRERERLSAELAALVAVLGRLTADHTARSAVVTELRAQHQELASRLEAGGGAMRAARQRLAGAQEGRHRAALREAQAVTELAHLEQSLAEDHPGLSMAHATAQAEPIANRAESAAELQRLREALAALGEVNVGAIEEYQRVTERIAFYEREKADLGRARDDLMLVMAEIDVVSRERLAEAFEAVNGEFDVLFRRVFGEEGSGRLAWCDPDNFLESGLEVLVQVPGKRTQNLTLLSGGERAMTTITLLLAMFRVKPTPFCLLDELDAPLDEANLRKYRELLSEFAVNSQFIVITHNPETSRAADTLYGITMEEPGVSRAYSHRLPRETVEAATGPADLQGVAPAAG